MQESESHVQGIVTGLLLALAEVDSISKRAVPEASVRAGHHARWALAQFGSKAYAAGLVDPVAIERLSVFFVPWTAT